MFAFMRDLFEERTYKLLFINPDGVNSETLVTAIEGKPISVVFDHSITKAYIIDTGLKVRRKKLSIPKGETV